MIQGLYAAANGMVAVEERQAVIANNIANASTTGFKAQIGVQQGFYETFYGKMKNVSRFNHVEAPGGGVKLIETFTRFEGGAPAITGNDLDVALLGPGMIAVETTQGERFTRSGRFSVGANNQLVTPMGHNILSTDGSSIDVTGGQVIISKTGEVLVGGESRGQMRILEFEDMHMLRREGYTLFAASQAALDRSAPAANTTVSQGALELSNVQLPAEMTKMLMALRAYAANQQVISSVNETASRLIDQVGSPG